jgi:pyruvate/2-oxoglutarate dehydrogenase complex dihydrolipoamide dehydrogenase (E3) component
MQVAMPEPHDAIIIGTGQGGKPLAGALAEAGWKTAIIEKADRVGGTCVVTGCTPTKTMIASARVAYLARRAADYGVRTGPVDVDMRAVRKRKRDIVESWSSGSRRGLERHGTLELLMGHARFTGSREITVDMHEGGARVLTAGHIFINVGTRPAVPPVPGLDAVNAFDNASIMELGEIPEHLIVIGGGFIGLEFGQMFRRFGSRVTILERQPHCLPREDEDVAEAIRQVLGEDGIDVLCGSAVEHIERNGGEVVVTARRHDVTSRISGSHLLVATGRVPNSDTLDPAQAGFDVNERGFIVVNERLETSVPGIYALGDVNGGPPFTHVSYDDFRILERNLLKGGDATTSGRLVPYTLFIDPQLGRVGLTERNARQQGYDVRVARLPMSRVARAIETDETRGLMKAVVDGSTGRILGAAILGIDGGEVASVIQVAMMAGLPYTVLRNGLFSHPTLSESLNNLFMAMDSA